MTEPETLPQIPASAPVRFSPALFVMALIPLTGVFIAIGLLVADSNARGAALDTTPVPAVVGSVGQTMPAFELTDLDGQPVDLAQYRGRPLFVNFWATWCPPCIEELPTMQAFAASQGDTGAVLIAANSAESPETIRAYFAENGLVLDDIVFVQDTEMVMYRWFGVYSMPSTFLVDPEGLVLRPKYGAFRDVSEFQGFLDEMDASRAGG